MRPLALTFVFVIAVMCFFHPAHGELLNKSVEKPIIFANSSGMLTYDQVSNDLSISALPISVVIAAGDPIVFFDFSVTPSLALHVQVDESGTLLGGVVGDDLVLEGKIDLTDFGLGTVEGVLLTGEVVEFGYDNAQTTDYYDFCFTVTGGLVASLYDGKDLGVEVTSGSSNFSGDFTQDFNGGAEVNVCKIKEIKASKSVPIILLLLLD